MSLTLTQEWVLLLLSEIKNAPKQNGNDTIIINEKIEIRQKPFCKEEYSFTTKACSNLCLWPLKYRRQRLSYIDKYRNDSGTHEEKEVNTADVIVVSINHIKKCHIEKLTSSRLQIVPWRAYNRTRVMSKAYLISTMFLMISGLQQPGIHGKKVKCLENKNY